MVYGHEVVLPKPALAEKLNKTYNKDRSSHYLLQLRAPRYKSSQAHYPWRVSYISELIIYGSICRLEESSVEKQLTRRQLAVKGSDNCNWYREVRKILVKYYLPSCWDLLDSPMVMERWRKLLNRKVNRY